MAPQVQTIAQAMADLDPAYSASRNAIGQQQANIPIKYDAQRSGIRAERGQAFNTINAQARGRGVAFGGIPLDEQATYLSTKYLPGLQQADFQQNEENLALTKELAGIDKELRLGAVGRVDKQTSDLNSWNQMLATQKFQQEEAERDRAFRASQSALDRSASAAARGSSGPSRGQIVDELNAWTRGKTGVDGKLSPSDFRAGYQQAAKHGMSLEDYNAVMYQYINTSHIDQYIG